MYIIQIIVAIISALNISEFAATHPKGVLPTFFIVTVCAAIMQSSSVLMRDIWIVFFTSMLMYYLERNSRVPALICIIITTLLRLYTLIITLPLFLYYGVKKEKIAVIVSLTIFSIFIVGQSVIQLLATYLKVRWAFHYTFDVEEMVRYILFPNIVNQTYNVWHLKMTYHAIHGGNTEWIYYLQSVWNLFVFPLSIYGVIKLIRERRYSSTILFGMIFVNVAMTYSLFYGNVSEPRHKLLILYPLAYFFREGYKRTTRRNLIVYTLIITFIVLGMLAVIS